MISARAAFVLVALAGAAPWSGALGQVVIGTRAPTPPPRGEQLIDEVAATLEMELGERVPVVVYGSELRLEVRLTFVRNAAPNPLRIRPHETVVGGVLNELLAERLLARQAARFSLPPPTSTEVAAEVRTTLEELGATSPEELFRVTRSGPGTLAELARTKLLARAFVRRQSPQVFEPTAQEVRAAFDAHRYEPYPDGQTEFEQVRTHIQAKLIEDAERAAIQSIFRSMGARARIRNWPVAF